MLFKTSRCLWVPDRYRIVGAGHVLYVWTMGSADDRVHQLLHITSGDVPLYPEFGAFLLVWCAYRFRARIHVLPL